MTLLIAHRRNTPAQLAETPRELGVEMDIRSWRDELVVHHDPFVGPVGAPPAGAVRFADWLEGYEHAFLVANVKEEGLEERVEELLAARGVERWTYLDQSFPFMVRTLRRGEPRCAVRISEFESTATALALAGSGAALGLAAAPQWVWVDSFTGGWPAPEDLRALRGAGLQLMVVSPELQARDPEPEVRTVLDLFAAAGAPPDAVCTKVPQLWA